MHNPDSGVTPGSHLPPPPAWCSTHVRLSGQPGYPWTVTWEAPQTQLPGPYPSLRNPNLQGTGLGI